jgi:DNA repair protein RAD50
LRRIEERETLIRSIGAKHHLKGYDHSPLEREKVIEFISRLGDLQRRQNAETERLQVSFLYIPRLNGIGLTLS